MVGDGSLDGLCEDVPSNEWFGAQGRSLSSAGPVGGSGALSHVIEARRPHVQIDLDSAAMPSDPRPAGQASRLGPEFRELRGIDQGLGLPE